LIFDRITKKKHFSSPETIILFVTMVFIIIVLSILLPDTFFSLRNFQSMAYQIPEFGLLALAMMIAMITGGIDLSVIATANLSGILAALILTKNITPETGEVQIILTIIIAIFGALILSSICGLVNGLLISYLRIPAIIATLGTMLFYSGIGMAITNGVGVVGFPKQFLAIGSGKFLIFPIPLIIFFIIIVIVSLILDKTLFGQQVYLLGTNPIAARFSGINNDIVLIKTYMLTGFLAGMSSIIMISRVNSAKVGYGSTYLLQAILVVVLGGVNPNGGHGKIFGVIMGILMLQILQSAFTLFGFSPYAKKLIWGLMLLIVMAINFIYAKHMENKIKLKK